ncbi:uncharacterized protein LOC132255961 [Phlebotomus argentipes]|uniref:uncharacterized protein LOC132255961 n=1 Tax=Phlebotomus argentipes TaxID=94469 RepID=UPI00289371D5|nr:uncharacterized protein LOC132255961 [Phlebotomus argentipes]
MKFWTFGKLKHVLKYSRRHLTTSSAALNSTGISVTQRLRKIQCPLCPPVLPQFYSTMDASNIADESFPSDVLLSDSSGDEDCRKSFPGISIQKTPENLGQKRSKSVDELSHFGTSRGDDFKTSKRFKGPNHYRNVPSKVAQYISALPKPKPVTKRLAKVQTMPEMRALDEQVSGQELKRTEAEKKVEELVGYNAKLRRQIQEMEAQLKNARESEIATIRPSEIVHEADVGVRRRFVAPAEEPETVVFDSSLVKHRHGKTQQLKKTVKKLLCCTGSDTQSLARENYTYVKLTHNSRTSD